MEKIMQLVTKKERIESVRENWHRQYKDYKDDGEKMRIYNELLQLNPLTEEGITKIIGNNSWTENECWQCGGDFETLIFMGEEIDYESRSFIICESCLREALKKIKESK